MLKDNWEEKHGINLPVHTTCSKGIQGTHVGNMIRQPFQVQGFSGNVAAFASSGSTSECSIPRQSNFQDGRYGFINQPPSIEPVSFRHRFDNQFLQQNHVSETQPTFNANPCGNVIGKVGSASHNMVSQLPPSLLVKNTIVEEAHKRTGDVCSQIEAHKSLLPLKSCTTEAEQSLVGSNLQELIKFLSDNHGPMKMLPETGTPEYLRLIEILQQSSVQPNGFSDQLNGQKKLESINGGSHPEVPSTHKPKLALTEDESSSSRDIQEKALGHVQKNDAILGPRNMDEKNLPSEKAACIAAEKLWEGSLQLSSSVTLSAVAFFKSGEKLLGNDWPEFIEVKGKVKLEAFEKYVQDLPRSRNRGLMVISVCWNEGSSNIGLTGMKEVAKGYTKSCRVGFAQLLPGIDLYICPRSDPIITILAKHGFFKGMSVIDHKQDSMIGCVVWRKNRPLNPVANTLATKTTPNSIQPHNSMSKQDAEKKPSPEKQASESSQRDEPLTLPLASAEIDLNGASSSSNSSPLQNLVRKRPFEDDDLPEFDFGIACGKSTLLSKPLNNRLAAVDCQKLDNSRLNQLPLVVNAVERSTNNGSLEQSCKKTKLFDDDDDDMPEWCPPELHHKMPPRTTTSNFQSLPPRPPLPTVPPPPRADTRSSFSYQPFRPAISSPATTFVQAPPPSGRFNSNQTLWRPPGSTNVNPLFPSSDRRRPQV